MEKRLSEGEFRIMEIIWDNEPLHSRKLTELCEEALGWKRSTTYTVLKRLGDKGMVKNVNTMVASLVSREEARQRESQAVVEGTFAGSLPSFLVSFMGSKTFSKEEAEELKQMIDEHSI